MNTEIVTAEGVAFIHIALQWSRVWMNTENNYTRAYHANAHRFNGAVFG